MASKSTKAKGSGPAGETAGNYFKQVYGELRKTTWPTWPELRRMTGIVIVTVIVFSLLIGGVDYLFLTLFKPLYS